MYIYYTNVMYVYRSNVSRSFIIIMITKVLMTMEILLESS